VFEQLGSEAASWSNQSRIEKASLQLQRERVAKLLSTRNAKQRRSSKRVPALVAHLPKFLEGHKIAPAASLRAACDNHCAKVGLDALKICAISRSWITTPESPDNPFRQGNGAPSARLARQ
jgi:hypothetical protein